MNYIYLPLILFLTFSCNSSKNNLYEFNPRNLDENRITISQIAEDINYIPLDNSYKIRTVSHVEITKNSIFLSSNEGVLKFTHDGKMVRKIGSKGRGPDEYIHCANFTVDDINETVYIKDRGNIIKVFSKYGSYLRSIPLQEIGSGIDVIEFYNSKLFVSYFLQFGDSQYNWIIIDTLGRIIKKKERTIPNFVSNWLEGSSTYKYESQLFYWNPYNDTVFSISQDLSFRPTILFGQGDYRLPKSSFDPVQEITHFMLIRSLFETKRFLVLRYSYNRKGNIALIDKKSKKSFLTYVENFEDGGITNDFDGGINFQPVSYYAEKEQEYMIGFFEPYKLKNHVTSIEFINSIPKYTEYKQKVESLAKSLSETDNPVLMIVRLKK
jgi:hypothetical protein